ncbi:MAG: hypothetical protein GC200_05900 [Tepidisphaera sp.]|nr:hypothetical protein [Tepidisphaera sp.]
MTTPPMQLCGISEVPPGSVLGSIVSDPRKPDHDLLRPGVELDRDLLAGLKQRGVSQLWIEDNLTKDLDAAVAPGLTASRLATYTQLRDSLSACARRSVSCAAMQGYRQAVMGMVLESIASSQYAGMTDTLFGAGGQASHGTNVAYLSLLCGLHIEAYVVREQPRLPVKDAREMSSLGLAGLLHDIGKTKLLPRVSTFHDLHAKENGGDADRPEGYTDHGSLGHAMLEFSRAPARVAYTMLHHHQRFDGHGWPTVPRRDDDKIREPLSGRRIHIFARIVAAANVLDNLLRDAQGERRPPVAALHAFASPRFDGWFDPVVRAAMLARIPPFAIGTQITLSNGRRGVVVRPNLESPCRPEVRLIPDRDSDTPQTLALDATRSVTITHALGVDVANYLYDLPAAIWPDAADECPEPNATESEAA